MRFITLMILVPFLIISGCTTTSNPSDPNNVIIGTMTAKIDGTAWSVPNAVLVSPLSANRVEGKTTITGLALNGTAIILIIDSAKVGTYLLPQIPTAVTLGNYGVNQDSIYSSALAGVWGSPGTITISEMTSINIKGTFSFKAFLTKDIFTRDSVTISEGVFNARFTN